MHRFRKFYEKEAFESTNKDSKLAAYIKLSYIINHTGLTKLDEHYFKTHESELVEQYLNAIPNLIISDEERLLLQNGIKDKKIDKLQSEKDSKISELETTMKKLLERIETLEIKKQETKMINSKINEMKNAESDPSNPDFPDGGPFDTRLTNLQVRKINKDSIIVFDSEFEESISVVLRKNKAYCMLDYSTTCKHVLFALGNPDFYEIVKNNNIEISFPITS
jgi:hypothetical protein